MLRLRLPRDAPATRLDEAPRPRLPDALRWDAPAVTVRLLLTRRQLLRAGAVAAAVLAIPFVRGERALAARRGGFLTRRERRTLEALCDRILPPDHDPGARALGAARYIENLLGALDRRRPGVFAGGPYSGRTPYPDSSDGTPSRRRPRNRFERFLELTPLQALVWRAELFGSASVPELAALDAQSGGPLIGLRQVYRGGLARVDEIARATAGAPFARLAPAEQDAVFAMLDDGAFPPDPRRGNRTFVDILIRHTLEGCFAVPEYGGNRRGRGWAMVGLEGDSQPLGYSISVHARDDDGAYVERPDHPMSMPNPDEVDAPRPLTSDGRKVQESISTLTAAFADGRC